MKKMMIFIAAIIIMGAMTTGQAQELDLMKPIAPDTAVRIGVLPNGAKYYVRSNKKEPQRANFHIVYNVGSVQEEDRQDGLAHFLEHMAFNGSKNFPGNATMDYLQSIGVKFGENLNAFTNQQNTSYMITNVPITREGIVDSVLLVLHDWGGYLSLTDQDIDKERGVIQEEFRLYEGMAAWRVNRKEDAALFGADNIYARRDIIGSLENLKNFKYEDIRDFYHKWYRPDLYAFVVVGDFDADEMVEKLKKTMSDIPTPEVRTPKEVVVVEDNAEPRAAVITDPEQSETTVQITYRHPSTNQKYNDRVLRFKSNVINALVANMLYKRFDNLSKEPGASFQWAYCVFSDYYQPFDMFTLIATAREGEGLSTLGAVYTELQRAKRSGFVAGELEREKASYLTAVEQTYANRNDRKNGELVSELVNNFMNNEAIVSADERYALGKKIIESITLDEVNAQIASLVGEQNMVVTLTEKSAQGSTHPLDADLLATIAAVDASTIEPYTENAITKPLLDASKLRGSKVVKSEAGKFGSTEWTLKNGIRVVVLPTEHKADEIVMRASRKGGTSTIDALEELYSIELFGQFEDMAGLGEFSDKELSRILAGKSASLSPVISETTTGYSGRSSKKDFETMLQLGYLYATAPRFEKQDFDVMIDKIETSIKGSLKDPMRVMNDSTTKTIYGGNPRRMPISIEKLSMISLDRMRDTYKRLFASADGMTFTIVGSFAPDSIKGLVEKYIGSLPVAKTKTAPAVGKHIALPVGGEVENIFVTKQEAGRVIALWVYSGDVKEYSLAEKLNLQIAGSALNNVYLKTIREAEGGAYMVNNAAQVIDNIPGGEWFVDQAIFMTDSSKLANLQPKIQEGIDSLLTNGPSPENFKAAVEAMTKDFSDNNLTNGRWVNYLGTWYLLGRDNYTDYMRVLNGITPASVQSAAQRAFSQGNRIVVIQNP